MVGTSAHGELTARNGDRPGLPRRNEAGLPVSTVSIVEVPGLVSRDALSGAQRDDMFELLVRHFDGVTRAQFDRDLAAKNWVVAVRRNERLIGFTTLRVTTSLSTGAPVTAIYSGDTIVAPEAWGSPALARAWIAAINHIRAEWPDRPCYWLLLTSGFRTYRFLPVFWREFFPRFDAPIPPCTQLLMTQLAREEYGTWFDEVSGIVRLPAPQRLRGRLAAVPQGREANPHVAFFLAHNPGHHCGDELVCLTEISPTNLTAAGRRMVATPPR
jgi:hypothetical protein